jgi:hypothetical protein
MERTHALATEAQPLPLPTARWVTRRKAALIAAVRNGEITLEEACRQYQLSPEEFAGWLAAFEKHAVPGLRVTRLQIYRDKPRSKLAPGSARTDAHADKPVGGDGG